jgi:hypothetical protein
MSLLHLGGSNFILHCCMYSTLNKCYSGPVIVLQKTWSGSLVLYCLIFQIFVTERPNFSISVLMSQGVNGVVHIFLYYFVISFLFGS